MFISAVESKSVMSAVPAAVVVIPAVDTDSDACPEDFVVAVPELATRMLLSMIIGGALNATDETTIYLLLGNILKDVMPSLSNDVSNDLIAFMTNLGLAGSLTLTVKNLDSNAVEQDK